MPKFPPGARMVIVMSLMLSLSACATVREYLAAPTGQEPTLEAISRMLTQTSAAPTRTVTATRLPSRVPGSTRTPTGTVVFGMRALPAGIGEPVQVGGTSLTVRMAALRAGPATQAASPTPRRTPSPGGVSVSVEVMLRNETDQPTDYSPGYFRLSDSTGQVFEPLPTAQRPALLRGTLQPGEQVWGNLSFQVATAANDLEGYLLQYAPGSAPDGWVNLAKQPDAISPMEIETLPWSEDLPRLGDRVETSGIALTISQVEAEQKIGSRRAEPGSRFLLLEVAIENVSRVRTPFNAEYFKIRGPSGDEYPAVILPLETMLQAGSLGEGQQVKGWVAFEAPQAVQAWMVIYQPVVLQEAYEEARVLLEIP